METNNNTPRVFFMEEAEGVPPRETPVDETALPEVLPHYFIDALERLEKEGPVGAQFARAIAEAAFHYCPAPAETTNVAWIRNLAEVGDPILEQVAAIEDQVRDIRETRQALPAREARIERDIQALERKVLDLWSDEEITSVGGPPLLRAWHEGPQG